MKADLIAHIQKSRILSEWHWFQYHFSLLSRGIEEPFASSIVDACLDCEPHLPGFAKSFISSIAAIGGREKDRRQYEQLLQRLAELLIIRQVTTYPWEPTPKFEYEPTAQGSKKNPEVSVTFENLSIGIEVKMPSLLDHIEKRTSNEWQVASRGPWLDTVKGVTTSEITLPRDNPMSDFLKSSDEKFKSFRSSNESFVGILVVVWDDFIYEPISALLAENSGLFTEKSFAKTKDGAPQLFENVDGVFIVRQMHQFISDAAERPLTDGKVSSLDYGKPDEYPFKAFIANPAGKGVPVPIVDCLQGYTPSFELGAEYVPSEIVHWT